MFPDELIKKSKKLDDVCYDIRGPVMDEASRMEELGMNVLKLNIGNPAPFGFGAPDEVILDMIYNLRKCEGYSDSRGLFSARKAIMQYCQLKKIPNVGMQDIFTGNGVSELIMLSMQGLLDPGDEILVPAPDYPLWTAAITLAGGTAVHYICDEQSDWYPDLADMSSKVTNKTKGIVVINPNNPTGALYPEEILQGIVDIARDHSLILFADEIYDRLVMDDLKHVALASLAPDLLTICFNGLSKSHRVAGFRCGWMCIAGDKSRAKDYIAGINLLAKMRLCSNVPAQSIIQTSLGGYQSVDQYLIPGGRIYEQREFIYKALCDIPGISVVKPKAAFYIFPKLDMKKFHIHSDEQFALDLLKETKILVTQGSGFHWPEQDHFRIVFLPDVIQLEDAMKRMIKAFGAEVLLTDPSQGTDGAIKEAHRIVDSAPDKYFMPNQFSNHFNQYAHYATTAEEIITDTVGRVTHVVSAIGTSGTIMGVSSRLKELNPAIKVVCAHPVRGHYIQGLKNMEEAIVPSIYNPALIDTTIMVESEEAFAMSRRIVREEGIFCGMSSGAAMLAAVKLAETIDRGVIVVIFPDRGEKYLSTKLFCE